MHALPGKKLHIRDRQFLTQLSWMNAKQMEQKKSAEYLMLHNPLIHRCLAMGA